MIDEKPFNYVLFKIKGLNHEKLISKITKIAKLYSVKKLDYNMLLIKSKYKDKDIFEKIIKQNGFEIKCKKTKGIVSIFENLVKRIGLVVGIVIFIGLLIVQSFFIFNIKITGIQDISSKEITNCLKEVGVREYTKKSKIDTKEIESQIKSKIQNISLVSVITKGTTLIINVKEKIKTEEESETLKPLTAKFSGKITSIELIQGTLNVKQGQTVKEGDILVNPFTFDSSGKKIEIKPMAKIFADTWIIEETSHNKHQITMERTGNKSTEIQLLVGNLTIFYKKADKFSRYETVISKRNISHNNLLPLKRIMTVYYETKEKKTETVFENVKEEIIAKCKQNALLKLGKYDIIKNERVTINSIAEITTVKYIIEVNKEIS